MSGGEAGRSPAVVRLEVCLLAEAVHAFLELPHDIAVEVMGVQDEQGCRLDQVRVGRWILRSVMVVACLSRTAGCAAYGQSLNVVFCLGESAADPIRPLQPSISAPPVILQSTHRGGSRCCRAGAVMTAKTDAPEMLSPKLPVAVSNRIP